MKKIVFSLIIILIGLKSFSQSMTKENYLQKSKNRKTTAWVLIGTGTTLFTVGLIKSSELTNGPIIGSSLVYALAIPIGGAITLMSIPYFLSSHSLKKSAASLAVSGRKNDYLLENNLLSTPQLTISLKVKF